MTINRRKFLTQTATASTFGIPLLRSLEASAQTAPKRLIICALQHGWGMRGDETYSAGSGFNLPDYMSPLAPFKDQILLIDGLLGTWWGNAHDVSYTDMLTGSVEPGWPNGAGTSFLDSHFARPQGPSIDHVIADHLGHKVLRMSANYRSWGVNAHPLSFDNNTQWLEPWRTPLDAFNFAFGGISNLTEADAADVLARRSRLFDFLRADAAKLKAQTPSGLQARVDEMISSIEQVSDALTSTVGDNCIVPSPPSPGLETGDYNAMMDAWFQLIETAIKCNTHQSFVLGLGDGLEDWTWQNPYGGAQLIGADQTIQAMRHIDTNNDYQPDTWISDHVFHNSGFHHDVAHYGELGDDWSIVRRAAFTASRSWYLQKVATLASTLSQISEGSGTALDNTAIVLTGEVSSGTHNTMNKGIVVIGGNAFLNSGRLIRPNRISQASYKSWTLGWSRTYAEHTENDFWVGLANAMGLSLSSFGLAARNNSPLVLT